MVRPSKKKSELGNTVMKAKSLGPTSSDRHNAKNEATASVVHESDLDAFLADAKLAGADFDAERVTGKVIDPAKQLFVTPSWNPQVGEDLRVKHRNELRIPRRPPFTSSTTPEELEKAEQKVFLDWRRSMNQFEERHSLAITPFEKNLEIWRQLWRVVERCHIVVQVLDARNPLLFRNQDLESYSREIDEAKVTFLLLNKADLLSVKQRTLWANYFMSKNIPGAFFAATVVDPVETSDTDRAASPEPEGQVNGDFPSKILTCDELISHLKSLVPVPPTETCNIGMVGYPNVGKSSTINKLFGRKIVPVSATPGKTKHFQTHYLEPRLVVCDCPGLVMPSVASSREEMLTLGILPIDQMFGSYLTAIGVICSHISRAQLESKYSLALPKPGEQEDPQRPPTPHELLTCHAYMRGYMSAKGVPDGSRSARDILKDYASGQLLYCYPPPGIDPEEFEDFPESLSKKDGAATVKTEALKRIEALNLLPKKATTADLDRLFFNPVESKIHVNSGVKSNSATTPTEKPWRLAQKQKRNSKQKSKRLYSHLDA